MFEKETIQLYHILREQSDMNPGNWRHSPIEDWKVDYFRKHLTEKNLINFRRLPLSGGTINFPDRPIRRDKPWLDGIPLLEKLKGIEVMVSKLYKLKSLFNFKLSDLSDNLVGNPCVYRINRIHITEFSIRMRYYVERIGHEFDINEISHFLEIGSGFGGLCLKLISSPKFNVKAYVLIDLPENLVLSYWYLRNSGYSVGVILSEEHIRYFNRKKGRTFPIAILLPPWMFPKINMKVDLFINIMSFQHMTKENVDFYFSEIERINPKYLYLVNRDSKRDLTDVRISEYPIPSAYILIKEMEYPFSNHLERIYSLRERNEC